MFERASVLTLTLATLGGCALFTALGGNSQTSNEPTYDPQAEAARQAEEARLAQEQADQQLAAEITPLRDAALAEGATVDQVVALVEKVAVALQTGAITRGVVAPEIVSETDAALDRQLALVEKGKDEAAVNARVLIYASRGYLRASEGRSDDAAQHYLAALKERPTLDLFNVIASLQRSPVTDGALAQGCPLVRDQVDAAGLPDFVALCLEANAGDRKKLTWKSAKKDLQIHDAEMARREEEARRAAEEAERIAAEQAALAAQAQSWARAAVFAAGTCRFQNCLKDGWEAQTSQGTLTTTCRFQDCLKDGWETRLPDGDTVTTTCRFQDCMKDGWETRFPDGSTATTTCRFQNCPVDGWETRFPDGSSATTTCRFQDCFKDGWETSLPTGDSVTCTCRFQSCLQDGTECSG